MTLPEFYKRLPMIQLLALQSVKSNYLGEKEAALRDYWEKEQKCGCPRLPASSCLDCKHVRKFLREQIGVEEDEIWELTLLIASKSPGAKYVNVPDFMAKWQKKFEQEKGG